MKDQNKNKAQLIAELESARQRVFELERSKAEWAQAEEALRESRERYRELFEMVPVCLWEEDFSKPKNFLDELRSSGVTDLQAYFQENPEELVHCASLVEITDVNETAVQLAGVKSKEQLLGNLGERFVEESYKSFQKEIIALYEGRGVFQGENVSTSPQGKRIFSEINGKIASGYEDTWGKYLVAQIDITERKQVELELKESEERIRTIFNTEPECVKILNPDTTLVTMNPAGLAMIEAETLDMVKGQSVLPIIDEEFRDDFRQLTDNVCQKGQGGMLEFRITGLKGNSRWLETHAVPLHNSKEEVTGLLGVTRDVTERKQIEATVRAYQDRFRVFFNSANDAIFVHPLMEEGFAPFIEVNDIACQRYGYSREEFLKLTAIDITKKTDVEEHSAPDNRKRLLQARHLVFETVHIKKSGEEFPVEINAKIIEEHGRPVILAVVRDITERRKSQQALKEREAELQSIFRAAPVGIGMTIDRVIQEANRMLCQMTGYTRDELVGQSARMLYLSTEDYEYVGDEKYRMIKEQGIGTVETQWKRKNGDVRDILLSSVPLEPDDLSKGVTFTALDITERKQAEERFKIIYESAPDAHYIYDLKGVFVEGNKAAERLTGFRKDELIGKNFLKINLLSKHQLPKAAADLAKNRLGKPTGPDEFTIIRKDGSKIEVEVATHPVNISGKTLVLGTARDITKRVQAESAVKESEARYRNIVNSSPLGMHMYELHSSNKLVFSGWNPAADKILGVDNSIFVGKTIREAFPPLLETEVPERYKEAAEKGVPWKTEQIDYDADGIKGAFEVVAFQTSPGKMVAMFDDVTTRKQTEERLQKSEERFRAVAMAISNLIWESDHDADTLEWFGDVDAALGYEAGEFPRTIEGWMSAIHPDDLDKVTDAYEKSLASGNDFYSEYRIQKKDGSILFWEDRGRTTQTRNGEVVRSVGAVTDITHRKQAEQALRTKTGELETLFSISKHLRAARSADEMLPLVVSEMRNVLGADTSAIILLDPNDNDFIYAFGDGVLAVNTGKRFATEKSISGLVLQTSEPYVTKDLSSDPMKASGLKGVEELGPAVIVPLQSEEDFLGVLVCARERSESDSEFSEPEVQLLTAIGEMVGNALRRARLFDQALTRLQNVQALRSIDMAISANMELSVVLEVLLAQGSAQLDVDAASVLLLDPHTLTLKYEAGYGFRTKAVESANLRIGDGLPGQVALKREILHVSNLSESDVLLRKEILREGFVSYQAAPLIAKGQLQGILEMFSRTPIVVDDEKTGFLQTLATQAAIAIDNAQLFIDLQRSNFELEMAYDATIEGWSRALELRDQETEGHTLRVAKMTVRLAQAMGVRSEEIVRIRHGALLHDIGKMGVPDRILLKPGKLDDDEWEIMEQHTTYAYEMLQPIEFLRSALDIPHCHHEKWDGTGYPRGLKGEQIPLSARIFAVVDVWDALNSDRPYRKAWTESQALEYITANAGAQFDPQVVDAFLSLQNKNSQI